MKLVRSLLRGVVALAAVAALQAGEKKVVVISIDGLQGPVLAALNSRKLKTPNLSEFVSRGAVSQGLEAVFPTVTYPCHTTLATGRSPAAHGITANTFFDPERKMNGAWHWYAEEIRVPTLWDAARAKGLRTAGVFWPVTVGAAIDYNLPEFRIAKNVEDLLLFRVACTPGLLAEFEKSDKPLAIKGQDDRMRARMAAFLLRTRRPDLLMVHLFDLDHVLHGHGPTGPDADKALEESDECLGLIRQGARDAGIEKQTVFVVVSDHGFWPVEKTFSPSAVLASLGLAAPEDKKDAWRVAAHGNGGSFALFAKNPQDREAIDSATGMFVKLQKEGTWGLAKVALREELDRVQAYPGAFLAGSLASGYTVGYSTAAWVAPTGWTHGMHGYWPGPVELDASFVAFGPGVEPQRLPRSKLVDVAPTVARILGLSLPGVEGRSLLP